MNNKNVNYKDLAERLNLNNVEEINESISSYYSNVVIKEKGINEAKYYIIKKLKILIILILI